MPAGDLSYRASANQTVTGLNSLATSATLVAGWTSGIISNATNLDLDNIISGVITLGAGTITASTRIVMYLYARRADATWPDLFSAGTEGTEGAATVHSTQVRDGCMRYIWGVDVETGTPTNRAYDIPYINLIERLGHQPKEYALWVSHSTGVALAATGQQITVAGVKVVL